jgi:hypothetical protein
VTNPDWATIASLATAGGTLVLAVSTFASVKSANRRARLAVLAHALLADSASASRHHNVDRPDPR